MNSNNKLGYIDALRGYAILLVIFAHTGQMYPLHYPGFLKNIIDFGPRGVQLFFIVSALTLFLTTEKRFVTDRRPILSFFIRRFFRIAPLFYCGLIFYNLSGNNNVTVDGVISNLFFIDAINPTWQSLHLVPGSWSISAEMLFYLIFPLLFLKIKNLNQAISFTSIALLLSVIIKMIVTNYTFGYPLIIWGSFTPYIFPFSIPVFGIGICYFFIIFKKDIQVKSNTLIAISTLSLLILIYEIRFLYTYFIVILFGLIALGLSRNYNKIIENNIIKYFGKISFSMYIVHFGVIEAIEHFGLLKQLPSNNVLSMITYFLVKFILTIILTALLSTVTYFTIEVYAQELGKKIVKYINQRNISCKQPIA